MDTHVQAGAEENDAQRVEVADDIVGNAVAGKHGRQEVCGAANSALTKLA